MLNITKSTFSVFDVKEPMDLLTLIRKNRAALAEFRGEPNPAQGLFDTFAQQPLSSEETEEMTRIQTMYQDLHCSIRPMVRVTSGFGNSDIWVVGDPAFQSEFEGTARVLEEHWLNYSMEYMIEHDRLGMDMDEYGAYLLENGLGFSAEEFWRTGGQFTVEKLHSTTDLGTLLAEDSALAAAGENAHVLASQYVYYRAQFTAYYTGDELNANLQKLDEYFAQTVADFSAARAAKFAAQTEIYGLSGERGMIENSVTAITYELVAAYTDFAAAHPDYAGIQGTKDAWLTDDAKLMTDQLRQAFTTQKTAPGDTGGAGNSENLYSETELTYLGLFLDELDREISAARAAQTSNFGERMAALTWGMAAAKAETVMRQAGVSENLRPILERVTAAFGVSLMDEIDRTSERYSSNMAYFPPVNRQAVMRIYQAFADALTATGDVTEAHLEGCAAAQALNCYAPTSYLSSYQMGVNGRAAIQECNIEWDYFMRLLQTGENDRPTPGTIFMDKTIESILRYAAADARYTYDSRLLSLYSKNLDLKV